jgi:TonB family protein
MRSFSISLLLILLTLTGYARKSYDLSITISNLGYKQPIEGIHVSCQLDGAILEAITDKAGKVTFSGLKKKSFHIMIVDHSGLYKQATIYYYNPKRESETKGIYLPLEKETEIFSSADKKYANDTSFAIEQKANGELISSSQQLDNVVTASYHGGERKLFKYLGKTLIYPPEARDQNIQGKVHLSFVVQRDGTITDVIVEKSVSESLDAEAVRVVTSFPKWQPATVGNKAARAKVQMTVIFNLL